jgi:hypothetical protein
VGQKSLEQQLFGTFCKKGQKLPECFSRIRRGVERNSREMQREEEKNIVTLARPLSRDNNVLAVLQCYCREIRQMLTFISLQCPDIISLIIR